jgi:hypothetical protein
MRNPLRIALRAPRKIPLPRDQQFPAENGNAQYFAHRFPGRAQPTNYWTG